MEKVKEQIIYLIKNRFARNVATLQAGSFAGTLTQAVVGVLLARLLQPELFGVYSLAFGLAALAGLLLGAGTQEAVSTLLGSAYARQDREGVSEALAFLLKLTFYAGLFTALLMFFLPYIGQLFYGDSAIGWYAGIVIFGVFISASFNAVVQLSCQMVGKIRMLTALVFGDQLFRYGSSLIFVFMGLGVFGAVSGHVVGAVILFVVSIVIWERMKKENPIFPSLRSLFQQAKNISIRKYLNFSIWVAVDRNIGNLYMALPVVLTGVFVSTGEISFFKLAFGYINLAMSLLGPVSVLLNVEFPKMKIEDPQKLARNFVRVSMYGLLLSVLLTAGAIAMAPFAFKLLYGESFLPSVSYVFGLFAYGALFGLGVGLGPMWRAVNKVKVSIMINLIILGIGIPAGLLMIRQWGLWGAVVMVTLWFSISHLASFTYLSRRLKIQS